MDYLSSLLVLSLTWACVYVYKHILRRKSASIPPGPRAFPIIGNLFELGRNPHQSLTNLSKKFGPLMNLKLGSITTIVISSPEFAKEALHIHDQSLSSRTVPDAVHADGHHKLSVVWLPAFAQWRNLRKVMAAQVFSLQKLGASQDLRHRKVQQLLDFVHKNCRSGQAIDVGRAAFTTVLNLMSNTFFSIDLASYNSNVSQEFNGTVLAVMGEAGKPNLADYFPLLQIVDPQGVRRRTKSYFKRLIKVFEGIITERLQLRSSPGAAKASNDVLDFLLNVTEESNSEFSLIDIKHLILDLFVAGTDTTARTLEWGMAELLRNPEKLAILKNELKEVEVVKESDIYKFPYLQATVKETLRLHPPAPFLVPHKAESEVEIGGFKIPKNAQILVNVWAMGRDASIWKNPENFEPERFLERKIDMKGRDFELIPFGAGRRICPGLPLAHRTLHLTLASLVHSFNWQLADGIKPHEMDMSEAFGLTLSKALPLQAIPYL